MGARIITIFCCVAIAWIELAKADSRMSVFCQRFPNNPNCVSSSSSSSSVSSSSSISSSSSSNGRPVDPHSVGLPPPPGQGGSGTAPQPAPAPAPTNNDPCTSWKAVYDKYCVGGNAPPEYKPSCGQYAQTCLGGGGGGAGAGQPPPSAGSSNGDPCSQWRPVYDKYCLGSNVQAEYQASCAQFQQKCLSGGGVGSGPVNPNAAGLPPPPQNGGSGFQPQPQPQPQPQGSGSNAGSTWAALTQKAQEDQAQRALIDAQNGAANCGQYKDNYNVWCGGVKQVNALYCNTLGRVCNQQAQQAAAGQSNFGGPFAGNGGLPTGGAGSTRPLTIGNNFGVGPFFGMDKTLGINPLEGVGRRQGFNVPIAGIGVQSSSGVDWGGLPGVAQLGAALNGRRRRWAIPVGRDHLGNVVYFIH